MSDDPFMKELGQVARAETDIDERLERLAEGRLTQDELKELESMAENDPRLSEALAAFRPLGDDFQARTVERLDGMVAGGQKKELRRRGLWFYLPIPAALAAAVLLVVLIWPAGDPGPLPSYQIEIGGGASSLRGPESSGPLRLVPGTTLQILLRPDRAVEGEVGVLALLLQDNQLKVLSIPRVEARGGAVKLGGVVGKDMPFVPGAADLVVLLARPDELPEGAKWREAGESVQVFSTRVLFEGE
jgi:hypothetical protein